MMDAAYYMAIVSFSALCWTGVFAVLRANKEFIRNERERIELLRQSGAYMEALEGSLERFMDQRERHIRQSSSH